MSEWQKGSELGHLGLDVRLLRPTNTWIRVIRTVDYPPQRRGTTKTSHYKTSDKLNQRNIHRININIKTALLLPSNLEIIQMQDKLQTRQPATKNECNKCREYKGASLYSILLTGVTLSFCLKNIKYLTKGLAYVCEKAF